MNQGDRVKVVIPAADLKRQVKSNTPLSWLRFLKSMNGKTTILDEENTSSTFCGGREPGWYIEDYVWGWDWLPSRWLKTATGWKCSCKWKGCKRKKR